MTREIKFRFWDKAQSKFTDYGAIHLSGSIMTYSQTFGGMYDFVGDELEKNIVVQQYTGLKDKKGVEVYEGDLLDIKSAGGDRGYVPVVFRDASFMMHIPYWVNDYYHLSDYDSDLYEVIGNIYENGNLLEANQ